MVDVSGLSVTDKTEISVYIKEDTLDEVNKKIIPVKTKVTFYTQYGKRFLDIVIGLLGMIISLPLNTVIGVVTFFDVGRPIFYKSERIGKNMKPFVLYKFRNMTNDRDVNGELLPPSQRVTKWGKFVRKTSLDELLNFISVLKGDMSIIGPRPLLSLYSERMHDRHKAIYYVKPGLECPPIKRADHELSWQERFDAYVWYVENCSLWVDIQLCFRVLQISFDRKNTAKRSSASSGGFLGYSLDGNVIYTKEVPEKYVHMFLNSHGFASIEEAVAARSIE